MSGLRCNIEMRINRLAFGGSFFEEGDEWIAVMAMFVFAALSYPWWK